MRRAPNAPCGTGKSRPLSVCRISRNSWVGRLAPRAPEMRGTCAPRCERDRVCLGMGLAGCPQYQDTSSVTQEASWAAESCREPFSPVSRLEPAIRSNPFTSLVSAEGSSGGELLAQPQVRTPQANRVVHPHLGQRHPSHDRVISQLPSCHQARPSIERHFPRRGILPQYYVE